MTYRWLVMACAGLVCAGLAVTAADPAAARVKHKVREQARCVDRPYEFSFDRLLFGSKPRPNGCSPAVYQYGKYIGQDPDPNIRAYLMKDPATGYSGEFYQ